MRTKLYFLNVANVEEVFYFLHQDTGREQGAPKTKQNTQVQKDTAHRRSLLPICIKSSHRMAWLLMVSGSVLSFPCILAGISVKNPFFRDPSTPHIEMVEASSKTLKTGGLPKSSASY